VVDRSRTVLRGLGLLLMYAIMAARMYSQQTPARPPTGCRIEAFNFEGWQAQQVSNSSVKLVIVPQLGGRVMQVVFDGHPYLFINPKYKGQYFPPSAAQGKHRWFNYGGDKIWPMPEGDEDEHHWPGPISDPLDDGEYVFKILSEAPQCAEGRTRLPFVTYRRGDGCRAAYPRARRSVGTVIGYLRCAARHHLVGRRSNASV